MSAALSQPDADRFSIYIDAVIDAPRFSFSSFCTAARISAAEALAWLRRPEIESALQSCVEFIQCSARIRHAVLDTNAMGALGELLKSDNQIEIRRAATTIISRHRANMRRPASASGGTDLGVTALLGDASSASRTALDSEISNLKSNPASALYTTDLSAGQCATASPSIPSTSRRDAASVTSQGRQPLEKSSPHTSPEGAAQPTSHLSSPTPQPSRLEAPAPSPLSTQNSALSTSSLLRELIARAIQIRKNPPPREPHSVRSLLNRVGSTRSRDHP